MIGRRIGNSFYDKFEKWSNNFDNNINKLLKKYVKCYNDIDLD